MASVISAGTSTGSALNMTGDTSGALALATNNGTTAVTINTSQNVGIGCVPGTTYQLDIQNPSTASSADTNVRIKSNGTGDGDAVLYIDAHETGEAQLVLSTDGVNQFSTYVQSGDEYIVMTDQVTSNYLYFLRGVSAGNDPYAFRFARDSGEAVITGITGTITSSATTTTITGLSTTTGLYKGMTLTKTSGTGAFASTTTTIRSIDAGASTITIDATASGTATAGSITFTATPNPTTVNINATSAGTWTADQDFARLAFSNSDTSGAGDGGIKASINAYTYDTAGTGAGMDFYVSSNGTTLTRAARINESGNLLVNSTTNVAGQIWIGVKAGVQNGIEMAPTTAASYGAMTFRKNDNSGIGSISCSTSATSFTTTSDYRLKENITPMTGALTKVALLKPVTYTWKDGGEDAEGFIAHELAEVCPHAVTGEKDAVDEEGNPVYQGIDTSFLVATLTAAIQELKIIVDAQAVEIAALKTQVGA